jgi:hypothetical protein
MAAGGIMFSHQHAFDNANPYDNEPEIPESVYDEAAEKFAEDWLCYTDLPEKAHAVLTKFAQNEKPNDLELQVFKKELSHAYDIAEEHYTDDYVAKWLRENH